MNSKTRNFIVLAAIAYHVVCMGVILLKEGMTFPKAVLAVMFIPQFYAAYLLAGLIREKKVGNPEEEIQRGLPGGRPGDRVSPSLAAARAARAGRGKSLDEEAAEAFEPVRIWGYRTALGLLALLIIWYYVKFVFS